MTNTAAKTTQPHRHRWLYLQMDEAMSAAKGFPMEVEGKKARTEPAFMACCYGEYGDTTDTKPGCGTTKFEGALPPGYVKRGSGWLFSKSQLDREVEETAGTAQEAA